MAKKLESVPKVIRKFGELYTLNKLLDYFERLSVNTRGGYDKQKALAFGTADVNGGH